MMIQQETVKHLTKIRVEMIYMILVMVWVRLVIEHN